MLSKNVARVTGLALAILLALVPATQAQAPTPAIVITETGGSTLVTEGGATDSYSVHLGAPPAGASLTVTIASTLGRVEFVTGATHSATKVLTFTPANYNTNQVVTVAAVDDGATEGTVTDTLTHTPSADPAYSAVRASLSVAAVDNDPGLALRETGAGTMVREDPAPADARDTFTLSLGSAPTADVKVKLTPDPQLSLTTLSVTFTPLNWNSARTVTVTAANDNVAQGDRTADIGVKTTSADPAYNSPAIPDRTLHVSIVDNDVAGLLLTQGGNALANGATLATTLTEGNAANDQVGIALTSQPTATITVALGGDGGRVAFASPSPAFNAATSSFTFTPTTWNAVQTVTITPVDDRVDQGADTAQSIGLHFTPSGDSAYNAAAAARSQKVNVVDNDQSGIVLKQGATTLTPASNKLTGTVDEAHPEAPLTYTVALNSQPTATTTVSLALSVPDGAVLSPASLTFYPTGTTTPWDAPQTVTLSPASDSVDRITPDATRVLSVAHHVSAGDSLYLGLTDRAVRFDVQEDDNALLAVTPLEASPSVSESGDAFDYTVQPTTQPSSDIAVQVQEHSGGRLSAAPSSFTFTSGNWQTPVTVHVTAVNDASPGLDASYSLSNVVTTTDPAYSATVAQPADLSVKVLDDDGVLVLTQTAGSTQAAEGGTDTYTIALAGNPAGEVTVQIASDDTAIATVTPATLTFEPSPANPNLPPSRCQNDLTTVCQWDVPRQVTVTAAANSIVDGERHTTVRNLASSMADARFTGHAAQGVAVTAFDDDVAGVVFNGGAPNQPASLSLTEGGSTSLPVRLGSQPSGNVVVTLAVPAATDGSTLAVGGLSQTTLTFTPATWSSAQNVAVASGQDSYDQGASYLRGITFTAASADPAYAAATPAPAATVTVTDPDVAGFVYKYNGATGSLGTAPSMTANEGATAFYDLHLNSQPYADVTVTLAPQAFAAVTPDHLTFTTDDWNVDHPVTVTASEDNVDRGTNNQYATGVTQSAGSDDPLYRSIAPTVTLTVTDNDDARVILTGSVTATEGGTGGDLTVTLNSEPLDPVTVTMATSSELQFTPSSVTLDAGSYAAGAPIHVTAIDDASAKPTHTVTATATASGPDAHYAGLQATSSVTVHDNDGVLILSKVASTVTEGGAEDTYTVRLASPPASEVTLTLTSSDSSQFTVDGAGTVTLAFEPTAPTPGVPARCPGTSATALKASCQWDTPQTVHILAVDNPEGELTYIGSIRQDTAGDPNFAGAANPYIAVTVLDDDASIKVTQTDGSTSVHEGPAGTGTSDTYSIVLTRAPAFSVAITLTTDGQVAVDQGTLFFDADSWDTPQVVTVTAVDDHVAGGTAWHAIHHSVGSGDTSYNGYALADVLVQVVDDDGAGVAAAETGGSTAVTEGDPAGDHVAYALASQPTADVTLTFSSPDGILASPLTLTFTASTWAAQQDVLLTVADNHAADGPRTGHLHVAVSSADAAYAGLSVPDLAVTINDP
jgi:hypothetical protein